MQNYWKKKKEFLGDNECKFCTDHDAGDCLYESSDWDGGIGFDYIEPIKFCPLCGKPLFNTEKEE